MYQMEAIRPSIERLSLAIANSLRLEIAIFDRDQLFFCTPTYLKKKGRTVHSPSIQEVMNSGSVLVNTPAALGGIGATTCLFPALTLGCGAVGGSSSSNNIGPLDLINIKRVAWGVKELEELRGNRPAAGYAPCAVDESLLNELVNRIIGRLSV